MSFWDQHDLFHPDENSAEVPPPREPSGMTGWEWVALGMLVAIILACVYDVWSGVAGLFP